MSLHPIADKAEVSVDFPDKVYIGSFGRHSQFDAYADTDSVAIRLVRPGEDRRERWFICTMACWPGFFPSWRDH
jgi:hypothetical protein